MDIGLLLLCALIAYAMGGIPSGLIITRRFSEVDLRSIGSGNVGATNVYRALGLKWAVLVFFADAAKGLVPVLLARGLALDQGAVMLTAFLAVCGHVFNPYLKFQGGKGVATAFGAMLGVVPGAALLALLAWAGVSYKTRIISAGSLASAAALVVAVLIISREPSYQVGVFFVAALVAYAHRENIGRLLRGEEKPIGRNR